MLLSQGLHWGIDISLFVILFLSKHICQHFGFLHLINDLSKCIRLRRYLRSFLMSRSVTHSPFLR